MIIIALCLLLVAWVVIGVKFLVEAFPFQSTDSFFQGFIDILVYLVEGRTSRTFPAVDGLDNRWGGKPS
jgi:hypothetical protein